MALRRGHIKITNIPERLLGDDVSEERRAWLGSKVPLAEIEEVKAEDARLKALFQNAKSANPEESGT